MTNRRQSNLVRLSEAVLNALLLLVHANVLGKCVKSIGRGDLVHGSLEHFKVYATSLIIIISAPLFYSKDTRAAPSIILVASALIIASVNLAIFGGTYAEVDIMPPMLRLAGAASIYGLGLLLLTKTAIGQSTKPIGLLILAFIAFAIIGRSIGPYVPGSIVVSELDLLGTYGVYLLCAIHGLACLIFSGKSTWHAKIEEN